MKLDAKSTIETGKAILGIELGSTRIKAVLIDHKTNLSLKAATHGKINWSTDFGLTALMPSGPDCKIATPTSAPT